MGDHIWLVRNPGGRVLSASVQNVGGALNELANAGNGNHHRAYMHFFRECWEDYPNHKDRYEHNGYTLTREPLPTGTAGVVGLDSVLVAIVCDVRGGMSNTAVLDKYRAALAAAPGMGEQSDA